MSSNRSTLVAKNTLMLYLRMGITMFVSIYTSRIVLNTLGVVDYGINNVVGGAVTFLTFLVYSMNTATQRFLNVAMGKGSPEQVQEVFSASVCLHLIILAVVLVVGEVVGLWLLWNKLVIPPERMQAAFWLFQFTMVSTCTAILKIPYSALVIAHERMGIYAWLAILDTALKLLVAGLLIVSPADKLITFGFLTMCTFLINRLLYTLYCRRNFPDCRFSLRFPRSLFKEMISFAGWDLFGVFAWACATQGGTILLNMFFGPAVNAARGIAGTVLGAVKGFSTNFTTALNPAITKAYAAGDHAYMTRLMYSGSKLVFVLLFTIMLPLFIRAPYVLELWLKLVPEYSVPFVRILLGQTLVLSMWAPLFIVGLATGRIRSFGFLTAMLNIMQLPVAYAVLRYGVSPIIAVACVGIWEVMAYSIQLYKLGRLVNFRYLSYIRHVQVPAVGVLLLVGGAGWWISQQLEPTFISLILLVGCTTILSLSMAYALLLDSKERSFIQARAAQMWEKVRRK